MFVVVEELKVGVLGTGEFVVLDTEDKVKEVYSYRELIHFARDLKLNIKGVYLNVNTGVKLSNTGNVYSEDVTDVVCVWSNISDKLFKVPTGAPVQIVYGDKKRVYGNYVYLGFKQETGVFLFIDDRAGVDVQSASDFRGLELNEVYNLKAIINRKNMLSVSYSHISGESKVSFREQLKAFKKIDLDKRYYFTSGKLYDAKTKVLVEW